MVVSLELAKPELAKDFRPVFVSFIKNNLSDCGEEFFQEFYKDRDSIAKKFTFGVRMNHPKFVGDTIQLGGNLISLTLSSADAKEMMLLYNAMIKNKKKTFPLKNQNHMQMKSIRLLPEQKVHKNEFVIKMLSPMVLREHNRETNIDRYVDCTCDDFAETAKKIVQAQLSIFAMDENLVHGFTIVPVIPKKTVVTAFDYHIDVSLGVYKLTGQPELLNFLYHAGIGSRRSQGFGMFEILA
ncbi:CRISPR-associated endoribonuclease Cas6 [Anaerosinus massiliensis]|uniref:CRISPR-associated endoribonuclease Cas6 n=1 Tax=Massilibacillus massiliensis TaxID=1806837 RepID=UPI001F1A50E9|nr:CRISPR-associated endoribonuclease Cas6 [Massilibacillus massiliensis]